ncbi:ANTAR domain-containing protein [Amycolatopsis minnesotensis]|uniref:ANTAR domain-containing protein n=1 Tax=Amycolatopsis minnesotensis TaxID=337894 RepID=UPI0031D9C156
MAVVRRYRAAQDKIVLEQAVGVLMERWSCEAEQARTHLVRLSAAAGLPLAEVAGLAVGGPR